MTTATLSFDHLLPEGKTLLPFQTTGVAYASIQRRTFIADEMGLGKTWQALLTLEANDAFPAVVVCPTTLRGNWANEIRALLPHRSVEVVYGTRVYDVRADIVVVGESVLKNWADTLAQPNALVLDESHYFKNEKAQRSKAAQRLADSVPAEGVVLCLTGTPIQNRPVELISQLRILGRLEDVAPRPRKAHGENGQFSDRDWEFSFKFAYCGPVRETHGWKFDGASNLDTLNERLRSTCMVRRERQDVLGLLDTVRREVRLSLNGGLKTYRQAESNIVNYMRQVAAADARIKALNEGDDPDKAAKVAALQAENKARRAEILVTLTTLRNLAGQAKVEAAVEWVENFLDSNPTKSVILFAWHKDVQQGLIKALADYNPSMILGGQADVEAQKARFQAKETRVIVCSIKAASEGHTLTAASDVLFVEQPWHSGAQQQAEDRANRLGQQAEMVFSWTLLAETTIDEWVYQLISDKRRVVRAAIVGDETEAMNAEEDDVATAILARFREQV